MINLYIDFDEVIKDTIRVSYKMMADLSTDLNNRADVIKFYQSIDWNELLDNSEELNNAFQNINKIYEEKIFRPAILTTVAKNLSILKNKYILRRICSNKNGRWKLIWFP